MYGEKNYLKEINPYTNIYVNFSDGGKGNIIGKGKLDYPSLPSLNDVLLVEDLTINLINISQQCNQELCVNFNRFKYIVTNKHLEQIMNSTKS